MNRKRILPAVLAFFILASFSAGCSGSPAAALGETSAPAPSSAAALPPSSLPAGPESTPASSAAPAVQSSVAPVSSAAPRSTAQRLSDAVAALKANKAVTQFTVSHSGTQIAVLRDGGDYMLACSVLSVRTGKEAAVAAVPKGNLYDPAWSFGDKYLAVQSGTAVLRTTYLLLTGSLKLKTQVKNTGMVWSPDSARAAFSVVNKVKPAVEMELGGTTDIMLLNADTLRSQTVLKAGSGELYTPEKWDASGLSVMKYTLPGNEQSTVRITKFPE